ncbi:unnamed protein product [Brugia timori]|uniref:Uncharacterized protein n=1 Tax=Brugia timori TaxID=42155 RepID=A0A0R3QPV2_9BILA|nr:unnamed protein product [Brugia timori]
MLYSKRLATCAFRIASGTRYFHLGHEFAPPARFISHHVEMYRVLQAKFGLALLSTAIQLSSFVLLYLNADKLRPPPPRRLSEEVAS